VQIDILRKQNLSLRENIFLFLLEQAFVKKIREKALEVTSIDKSSKGTNAHAGAEDEGDANGIDFQRVFSLEENVYRLGYMIEKYINHTNEFFELLKENEPSK
jgi:hypothetical protein